MNMNKKLLLLLIPLLVLAGSLIYAEKVKDTVQFECTAHNYKSFPSYSGGGIILREITILTFYKDKIRAVVKGRVYSNGEDSTIDRVAFYDVKKEQLSSFRLSLVDLKKMSRDTLTDENLIPYIFGLSPGESRVFRFRWINDSTLIMGSQTQFQTACTHYPI